jgi:dipeptidyl-peptidase-4
VNIRQTGIARWLVASLVLVVSASRATGQRRPLTLADIYAPGARLDFTGSPPTRLTWIDATRYARAEPSADGVDWTAVDVSGTERSLFNASGMAAALASAGVPANDARRAAHSRDLIFDERFSAAVANVADDLYLYVFESDRARRLTRTPGASEEHVSFSPDGRTVAFVRAHDLYCVDTANGGERRLSADGSARVFNGQLDWVYEEEIYGRGLNRAYWWSPDSTHLAFLHLDDRPVPPFTVVDQIPYEQTIEQWDYPKAGDPNPDVTLRVADVKTGAARTVNADKYPAADRLIVAVSWTPDSRRVVFLVQNRVQSFVDVNTADTGSLAPHLLLHEASKYWIDPDDAKPPVWLKDGTFLWLSTRSGFKHLYHYAADGTLIRQVTSGRWEVRTLHGVDPAGTIYFSGTERSPIGGDVYRIDIDGKNLVRLSDAPGTHDANFNQAFTYYIDAWSDARTPTQVRLHGRDGSQVRVIADNPVPALQRFALSAPEFVQVTARDGFVMEAMMIKPPDFDPSRKYPVYQFTYGGPHSQRVLNAWRGSEYMYHQLLAQHGIIVWICDNRTASGKGAESEWPLFRNFGESELRDIEDGIAWLERQPYVDASRIGLHGWSYGGYLTSYALTHSTSFVMGIAGGTVADWRDYDTVYTERYMGLPSDNAEGYRRSSPRWSAASLHGDLLLIHGAIDDNVHLSNTMQFVYELQKAGKPFQLMLYPKSRHSVADPPLVYHLRQTMLAYTLEHLAPQRAETERSASGHGGLLP